MSLMAAFSMAAEGAWRSHKVRLILLYETNETSAGYFSAARTLPLFFLMAQAVITIPLSRVRG